MSKEDTVPSNLERLLNWFEENNAQLNAWVSRSEIRAQLMLVDPLTAIQQAGLQISGDLIPELRNIAKAIGGN